MSRKQVTERICIFVIPIILFAGFLVYYWVTEKNTIELNPAYMKDFIKTMLGVYATLLGFSITAESILVTFQGGKYTELIIKAGHLQTVLFSFMLTNISLFVSLVLYIFQILRNEWSANIYYIFMGTIILPLGYLAISILYFFMMLSSGRK